MTCPEVKEGYAQGLAIRKLQRLSQGVGSSEGESRPTAVVKRASRFRDEASDGKLLEGGG